MKKFKRIEIFLLIVFVISATVCAGKGMVFPAVLLAGLCWGTLLFSIVRRDRDLAEGMYQERGRLVSELEKRFTAIQSDLAWSRKLHETVREENGRYRSEITRLLAQIENQQATIERFYNPVPGDTLGPTPLEKEAILKRIIDGLHEQLDNQQATIERLYNSMPASPTPLEKTVRSFIDNPTTAAFNRMRKAVGK